MITQGGFYIGDFNSFGLIISEKKYEIKGQWTESFFQIRTSEDGGYLNTIMMNSRNDSPIAKHVLSLNINGYDDWYIPSRNELEIIYKNKFRLPEQYEFENIWYWSSTENIWYWSSTQASSYTDVVWVRNFHSGNNIYSNKSYTKYVRAIRRFAL